MKLTDYLKQIRSVVESPGNRHQRLVAIVRALGWFVSKNFRKKPLVKTVFFDRKFNCYPDGFVSNSVMLFGEWNNYDILHFIDSFLRPGDCFLDVGANVGLYSLLASRHVGDNIICVEPGRVQVDRLKENLRDNSCNALILPFCVSDAAGKTFLTPGDAVAHIDPDMLMGEAVETERLDDLIPDKHYAIMKLDVEGFELKALTGANRLISSGKIPVIIFELNGSSERYGIAESDVPDLLRRHGYTLGMYKHDDQVFDTTVPLWDDVIALSDLGLEMLTQRMPELSVIKAEPRDETEPPTTRDFNS